MIPPGNTPFYKRNNGASVWGVNWWSQWETLVITESGSSKEICTHNYHSTDRTSHFFNLPPSSSGDKVGLAHCFFVHMSSPEKHVQKLHPTINFVPSSEKQQQQQQQQELSNSRYRVQRPLKRLLYIQIGKNHSTLIKKLFKQTCHFQEKWHEDGQCTKKLFQNLL